MKCEEEFAYSLGTRLIESHPMKSDAEREVAIFTEALDVPSEDRDEFLERKCGGDKELHRRLEGLLRAHERLGNFLEEPPTEGFVE